MIDDPETPQTPDPAEPSAPEMETNRLPEEQSPVESSPESPAPDESGGDYVSELRQSLSQAEASRENKGGGFFTRITGSLRRVTGPLHGGSKPLGGEAEQPAVDLPPQPEIADDFLANRLGGAVVSEPIFLPPDFEEEPQLPMDFSSPQFAEADDFTAEDAITLLDEGVIAAQGAAEEESTAGEPDWMAEIRQQAEEDQASAGPAPEGEQPPKSPGPAAAPGAPANPLRSFITGILHGRPKQSAGEAFSDEMVTGRLERSMGSETAEPEAKAEKTPEKASQAPEQSPPLFDEALLLGQEPGAPDSARERKTGPLGNLFAESETELDESPLPVEKEIPEQPAIIPGETGPLDEVLARFEQPTEEQPPFISEELANEIFAPLPDDIPGELSSEDEALLWGTSAAPIADASSGPTFTPEDIWGETPEIPSDPLERAPRVQADDEYASIYLTGEALPVTDSARPSESLLHEVLQQSEQSQSPVAIEDIRAIVLQDYQEVEPEAALRHAPRPAQAIKGSASAEAAEALEHYATYKPPFSLRQWLADLTAGQKVLLLEAAVVVLALLVAVPFFVLTIARGPVYRATGTYLSPRSLPVEIPIPTGMTLPGGWYFKLDKSTFVKGAWKPVSSEWLEGTELRRVVALPWNEQTEAVIRTFKPGDVVGMDLSNSDTLTYRISEVKRVPVSDTSIFIDRRPSLLIVLYQEKATERWVVICYP